MSRNDDHTPTRPPAVCDLRDAIRRLFKPGASKEAPVARDSSETHDWHQFIESELNAMNRRLTAIETRMSLVFYLVVIMTVVTVFNDAGAAQKILQGIAQIKP